MEVKEKKICTICGKEKPIDEFYKRVSYKRRVWITSKCKECYIARVREKYYEKKYINGEELVYSKPNKYYSDRQREDTFKLMRLMGWHFCKQTGKWHKNGKGFNKNKYGKWTFKKIYNVHSDFLKN